MAISTPTIRCCNLRATVDPAVVSNIYEALHIDVNVFFNSITSLTPLTGSFIPANNTVNIAASIPTDLAPNFIILITDGQANITLKSGGTTLTNQNPMMKVYFNPMFANSTYNISDIILDGTTAAPVPMAQGTQLNWTLVYGQGIIS